ncbi:interactor of constitutive active ROPs 1-like [Impatiens glandulifera]|uniref:interactor of constitutive active ROPs 1-like n=1 Tax=Impatiens glandulifera TaxID=253017 RepID=UPI001FB12FA3|nr:interactor of constitutive active ROPs 1-like [Impatiens glandulifera]XP_047335260.1 interactor of constitutive active ROPs 1-like [Impatiens glandulifera]
MSRKQSSPSRCDYDPLHRRPVAQRKSIIQTSSTNQKKLVGRINNLESQLGQAQEELKILKDQLNSTDTVKRAKSKRSSINPYKGVRESRTRDEKTITETNKETDVFEVPTESKDDINALKAMLEVKEKELKISVEENERLKIEVEERMTGMASAEAKEEEMRLRLSQLVEEVEGSKDKRRELILKMEAMEAAKEGMEDEMKKLRIQTEQWRKAADAAAVVMSEGMERRVSERWGSNSMDKQYGNIFENPVGVGGYSIVDELENELVGHEKRRGSGIRMIGDLWKKKVQK